jgi:hypothetical protein
VTLIFWPVLDTVLCGIAVGGSKALVPKAKRHTDATVDAARARFLARKQAKLK